MLMQQKPLFESHIEGLTPIRGKVRDMYDLGTTMLIVTTDRISAFDWVLPTPIPGKGIVLTQMTKHWLKKIGGWGVSHHMITCDVKEISSKIKNEFSGDDFSVMDGRCMEVHKLRMIPIECVARGYLSGSAWKEYQQTGKACGIKLPSGLKESQHLLNPIFTPAYKNQTGHDENISYDDMFPVLQNAGFANPSELAWQLKNLSISIYKKAAEYAWDRGIIIADTKFEFGLDRHDRLVLADEVLTPDSSRFWSLANYHIGSTPNSFDKQYVRDYLSAQGWDKNSQPPPLPQDVIEVTQSKYLEALDLLLRNQ